MSLYMLCQGVPLLRNHLVGFWGWELHGVGFGKGRNEGTRF